jgi:hypothetical protein
LRVGGQTFTIVSELPYKCIMKAAKEVRVAC